MHDIFQGTVYLNLHLLLNFLLRCVSLGSVLNTKYNMTWNIFHENGVHCTLYVSLKYCFFLLKTLELSYQIFSHVCEIIIPNVDLFLIPPNKILNAHCTRPDTYY